MILTFSEYSDNGDQTFVCQKCGALMWYNERIRKRQVAKTPRFTLCCMQGKILLPLLKEPLW